MRGRGQGSIEYLAVYAVAFMIVLVVLAAVYYVWNRNPTATPSCEFPMDFNCVDFYIRQNGSLNLILRQTTGHSISITGFNCTAQQNENMKTRDITVQLNDGEQKVVAAEEPCYRVSGEVATGSPGRAYVGSLFLRYTETDTGFGHTLVGRITAKYE